MVPDELNFIPTLSENRSRNSWCLNDGTWMAKQPASFVRQDHWRNTNPPARANAAAEQERHRRRNRYRSDDHTDSAVKSHSCESVLTGNAADQ